LFVVLQNDDEYN
jgi:hypothetical protein